MSRENKKQRTSNREREKEPEIADDTVRVDCPCPKTDCKNHTLCGPCRYKHRKGKPYCERDYAANRE